MSVERLTPGDPRYPPALMLLAAPPQQLYAQGDLSLLARPRVSVIGSRTPSAYGETVAFDAAKALASKGAVIVSGMARGLDACAHAGALDAGGGTIAILGTGLDIDYPRGNRHLLAEVRRTGLVLSEYELGDGPLKWHFPARNRIIAALAQVLLVVEGRLEGGTSNTVRWALDVEARIFGVPGRLGDELAESPNSLIRDCGTIYTHPNDILLELGLPVFPEKPRNRSELQRRIAAARLAREHLSGAEATLFDLVGPRPVHVDELAAKSEIDPGLLLAALSSLELQGLVTQLPGKHFLLAS